MAALLVAMAVMAVALSTALPVFTTVAKREKEAELVFRGEQYARAIGMFQQKYGNALPPSVDVLLNEKFLRKRYKDPMTGADFVVLGPNSPELAQAGAALPQQVQQALTPGTPGGGSGVVTMTPNGAGGGVISMPGARGAPQSAFQTGAQSGTQTSGRGAQSTFTQGARDTQAGQAGGGIIAVTSKSSDSSMRLYNGKGKYNEWVFMALQASTAAGAPPGSGAQTPDGRGGPAPGGRGGRGGRGGAQQPTPFGGRGNFGGGPGR